MRSSHSGPSSNPLFLCLHRRMSLSVSVRRIFTFSEADPKECGENIFVMVLTIQSVNGISVDIFGGRMQRVRPNSLLKIGTDAWTNRA